MQIRGFALVAAVACGITVAGQPAPPATGFILGRVVDASTGRGIGGAAVTLQGAAAGVALPQSVLADGDGNYLFHTLPAGTFRLVANAIGYLPEAAFGARRPAGRAQPIELAAGQRIGDAEIQMWPPASISGRVVDDSGEAVARMQLGLLRYETRAGQRRLVTVNGTATDERGEYRFTRLGPGSYFVWLLSQRTTIPMSTRELVDRARSGGPAEAMKIGAMMQGAYPVNVTGSGFRVGDAIVTTTIGDMWVGPPPDADGRVHVVRGVFHPGVPSPDQATAITLAAADRRTQVDFALRLEPSVRVAGVVSGPEGPIANLPIRLVSSELGALQSDEAFEAAMTITDDSGAFRFLGVPAGAYRLDALRVPPTRQTAPGPAVAVEASGSVRTMATPRPMSLPLPTAPTIVVRQLITVGDSDVVNVAASAQYGPRLSGVIDFPGAAPGTLASLATRARITLQQVDGRSLTRLRPPAIQTSAAGTFASAGLIPGRYVIRVDDVPGWIATAATLDGRDVIDTPFEIETEDISRVVITMSDRPAGITGVVRSADNSVDPNATVLVFPVDRGQWTLPPRRLASARASRTGTFRVEPLPAGDYFVAAVDDALAADWQAPEFLEALSRQATRVTIAAGEMRNASLRTAVMR